MAKNKIMFILSFYIPFPGAAWRRIEYFINYLNNKKDVDKIYVLGALTPIFLFMSRVQKGSYLTKLRRNKKIKIINVYPYIPLNIWLVRIVNIFISFTILLLIIILRPNVVIITVPDTEPLISSYIAARMINSKIIVDIRDPAEDFYIKTSRRFSRIINSFIKRIDFAIYRKVDRVITVTNLLAKNLARQGIKSSLIYNGADTEVFKAYNKVKTRRILRIDQYSFILVYLGNIGVYYDLDFVLDSIATLFEDLPQERRKFKFIIIGWGRNVHKLINKIKTLGLNDVVSLKKPESNALRLVLLISSADLGIIPRVKDPFFDYSIPVKFYEYIACGLPVLALVNKYSELYQLISKYELGLYCEPYDRECIVRNLKKLYFNRKLVEHFRNNVIKVRVIFDRKKEAQKLYNIIRDLI